MVPPGLKNQRGQGGCRQIRSPSGTCHGGSIATLEPKLAFRIPGKGPKIWIPRPGPRFNEPGGKDLYSKQPFVQTTYMFGQDWDPLISPPSQALMRGCNKACSTEKSSRPEFSRLYSTHRYATMGMALT